MSYDRRRLLTSASGTLLALLAGPASADRELKAPVRLRAGVAGVDVAGEPARLWCYDDGFPGPAIRLQEGRSLALELVNHLPEATNLHFHGLHVSPAGLGDNVFRSAAPGERLHYEVTVPEGEGGTYWYHPHAHHAQARQLWHGLAGPLIIESALDRERPLADCGEALLFVKDIEIENGRPAPYGRGDWQRGKEGGLVLVNGRLEPRLEAPSLRPRLRLINACNARYLRLALEDGGPFHAVALDGHFLTAPVEMREILIVPGARADLLIPLEAGTPKALVLLPYSRGSLRSPPRRQRLAILVPPHDRHRPALPASLAGIPALDSAHAAVRREITMANTFLEAATPDRCLPGICPRLGDLEIWELRNVDTMDHVFHLHTWYFQVLARNGRPPAFRCWRDTINLRPGEIVAIGIPFTRFAGRSVYHCHIAEHADMGMMAELEVVA
jgi:FtsP/CotA-like multicopper oxidase with cupredoxin domain